MSGEDPYVRVLQCSPHHTNSAMFPFVEQTISVIGVAPGDSDDTKVEKLVAWIRSGGQSPEEAAPVFGPVLGIDVSRHFQALDVPPQRHSSGRLRIDKLINEHGRDMSLPDLRKHLVGDFEHRSVTRRQAAATSA